MNAYTVLAPTCPSWCTADHVEGLILGDTFYAHTADVPVLTIPQDRSDFPKPGGQVVELEVLWCQEIMSALQKDGPVVSVGDMTLTLTEVRTLATKMLETADEVERGVGATGWPVYPDR